MVMAKIKESGEENKKREDFLNDYEKPSSHTNFWKTFGLDNDAGKLLYQLYGEKPKITPSASLTKREKTKEELEKEKEKKKKEEEEKERLRKQKMHISYPTYKKKEKPKEPEKISQRKPLAKILEETKNYEATTTLPEQLATNRDEEKKILVDKFAQEKCTMVPPSCAQLTLTVEEKNEILKNVKSKHSKYTENKEEQIVKKLVENVNELEEETNKKITELNKINEQLNKIDEYDNPKEYKKLKLQKIEIVNEIEDNKHTIQKSKNILESLK